LPGAKVLPLGADVAQESQAHRAVEEAVRCFGALHTLVNVAGIRFYTPLADADTKEWEQIIGVNLLATTFCCKAALPHLRAAGHATIVNVSSVFGVIGRAGMGQYDTTKAADPRLHARARGGRGTTWHPRERGVSGRHDHAVPRQTSAGARSERSGTPQLARRRYVVPRNEART
jgi:NAD(P)-dependent dehydrogenase (short-subunit alcohol dehydrogenase family)